MACLELEKASSYKTLSQDPMDNNSAMKPAEDLVKEIAVLELEVVYLEKYLLSLYRETFDYRISSLSNVSERSAPNSGIQEKAAMEIPAHNNITSKNKTSMANTDSFLSLEEAIDIKPKESIDILGAEELVDSSIFRSHSSLSHRSACSFRTPFGKLSEAVDSYHSFPLSMLEEPVQCSTSNASLAMHLGNSLDDNFIETPNWISEEMVKCISAIYSRLADPPLFSDDFPGTPVSLSSPMSESSPHDVWSSQCRENSSFKSGLNNPFHIEGPEEYDESYNYYTMYEVQGICKNSQKLTGVENLLQTFRDLISRLEQIDPRKMKHEEERLAFWINVHNALVMHALLVYGIPQSSQKRISLLVKAAYNIGGHTVSVDMIQRSILGCRLPRPGQWFQTFFFPKTKFKAGDPRKAYSIGNPEPLLHFGLCSGCHSDPAVRVYTGKRVFQELQVAREEYIETNIKAKEQKIYLPKMVESFAKEKGLCAAGLVEMIEHSMPDSLRQNFQRQKQNNNQNVGKFWKKIEWLPHNFTFRFLLSNELLTNS